MTTRGLVIVGFGGHGREALDIVEARGESSSFVGFAGEHEPDDANRERLERRGARVAGDIAWLAATRHDYVIAIGSSAVRRRIDGELARDGAGPSAVTLLHPSATVGSDCRLADGVIVGAASVITTNVTIGRHTHVNVGCAVQHDTTVGAYVTISPGVFVNGDVTIGDDVFFGTGAVITRGVAIGDGAIIGAGAVVLSDVAAGSRVLGVPARPA